MEPKLVSKIKRIINTSSLRIISKARKLAPVNTGYLRSSIGVTYAKDGLIADIKANANYALWVEFGTKHERMPPPQALQKWAEQHGFKGRGAGFLVARSIYRRGGLEPHPFLIPPFEEEKDDIKDSIIEAIRSVTKKR